MFIHSFIVCLNVMIIKNFRTFKTTKDTKIKYSINFEISFEIFYYFYNLNYVIHISIKNNFYKQFISYYWLTINLSLKKIF